MWIQRDEYTYYTGEAWHARTTHAGIDAEHMAALLKINTEGRLRFVEGDDQEILPGIRCYTGGRHTHASQYVGVRTAGGTAVITSDNMYLYENLEKTAPNILCVPAVLHRDSCVAAARCRELRLKSRNYTPWYGRRCSLKNVHTRFQESICSGLSSRSRVSGFTRRLNVWPALERPAGGST